MRGRTQRMLRVHERKVTSSGIALLFSVALCLFVFGRGPGSLVWLAGGDSNLRWLPFAGSGVSWMPYNHSVKWQPYNRALAVLPSPTSSPTPTAAPTSTPSATPAPQQSSTPVPATPPPPPPPSTPPPATPTPVPTPVVLFADDFSSDTPGNFVKFWTPATPAWSIVVDGAKVMKGTGSYAVISTGSPSWANYTVSAPVKAANGSQGLLLARYQNKDFYYGCGLDATGALVIGRRYGGVWTELGRTAFDHSAGFYNVSFSVNGSALTCKASAGSQSATLTGTASNFSTGSIGAATTSTAEFGTVTVTRLG